MPGQVLPKTGFSYSSGLFFYLLCQKNLSISKEMYLPSTPHSIVPIR